MNLNIYNNAFVDELSKIAKGKYPVVEDEVGKTLSSGAAVSGGGYGGYKISKKFKKVFKKRGRGIGAIGAALGATGGAMLYNKIKKG